MPWTYHPADEADRLALSLNFANTLAWQESDRPVERLADYPALVDWAAERGVLTPLLARRLRARAQREPVQARAALEAARGVRDTVYRLFAPLARGEAPAETALARFNQLLAPVQTRALITRRDGGYVWSWHDEPVTLDMVLWPILRSAAELLTTPYWLERMGQCADDRGCAYLFLDQSRNRSRRWCDINDCGNRAKQRRYVRRHRSGA